MLSRDAYLQVIRHVVAAELSAARGASFRDTERRLQSGEPLNGDLIQADSLEIVSAATAVNTFFRLHEAGGEDYLLRRLTMDAWAEVVAASAVAGLSGVTFRSGGTTGAPKPIFQSMADLTVEAERLAELVGPTRRVLCLAPLHHIYGFLWGALIADCLSAELIADSSAQDIVMRGAVPGGVASRDLIVAVPAQWGHVASAVSGLPAEATGVTSTAPADPVVIHALRRRGLGRMLELYGSSETGGIGWRDAPEDPYRLLGHWTRLDADRLRHQSGRVAVLPDRVEWQGADRLLPIGRHDGAVQVGGTNVYPAQIRDRLRDHPAVADCAVRPTDTGSGLRLKAFVVLADEGAEADSDVPAAIRQWVREAFSTAERPVSVTFGDRLPTNEIGKLADWPVDAAP